MNDKFSLYQTDGLWGIIENTSNEKQTSIKSYFGSDLIIKRLNEQDQQIDRLKQQLKEKDFIIKNLNHSLSVAPNANAGQRARIDELTKIVKEKDKEIEKLKQQYTILENENGKLTTELIMDKYKKAQKEVSFGIQLAIRELEKVKDTIKHFCNIHNDEYYGVKSQVKGIEQDVCDQINQQIKELIGE